MSKLIIKRISQWANKYRKIDIYLDNENIGTISDGETREFELDAGYHTLKAKIDWYSSREFSFTLGDNETKNLELSGSRTYGVISLLMLNDYLHIREIA